MGPHTRFSAIATFVTQEGGEGNNGKERWMKELRLAEDIIQSPVCSVSSRFGLW